MDCLSGKGLNININYNFWKYAGVLELDLRSWPRIKIGMRGGLVGRRALVAAEDRRPWGVRAWLNRTARKQGRRTPATGGARGKW